MKCTINFTYLQSSSKEMQLFLFPFFWVWVSLVKMSFTDPCGGSNVAMSHYMEGIVFHIFISHRHNPLLWHNVDIAGVCLSVCLRVSLSQPKGQTYRLEFWHVGVRISWSSVKIKVIGKMSRSPGQKAFLSGILMCCVLELWYALIYQGVLKANAFFCLMVLKVNIGIHLYIIINYY